MSKFGHARPLRSAAIIRYVHDTQTDRQTDRRTDRQTDKSNTYCPFPTVGGRTVEPSDSILSLATIMFSTSPA